MRNQCKAWSAKSNQRCLKRTWFGSRYCWYHLDKLVKWTVLLAVLALVSGWVRYYLPEAGSDVSVRCHLSEDWTPCRIDCVAQNLGQATAKEIAIGFNYILPLATSIVASPDTRLQLEESDLLPHPDVESARFLRAFVVRIPIIPSNDKISFSLVSTDRDNQRACGQVLRLRKIQHNILEDFYSRVLEKYPKYRSRLDLGLIKAADAKDQCLFDPGHVTFERRREPITFETETEIRTAALHQQIYSEHKKEFSEVFKDRGEYIAPVFLVKQLDGYAAIAVHPYMIKTYVARMEQQERVTAGDTISIELVPLPVKSYTALENLRKGVKYEKGRGVEKNYVKAAEYYSKAASEGLPAAEYNLGVMYAFGRGLPQDYAKAAKLFRRAAEQGHARAQYNLGVTYLSGRGMPRDDVRALMWIWLSSEAGNKKADQAKDSLAQRMSKEQIEDAERLAREWQTKTSKQ